MLGTVFSRDSTYLVSISRDRSVKLTEVATQRFIDNITSITPGALKGGLMALARNPQKTDQKVKNTAAGTDTTEKWYDELALAGSDGTPRLYKMHRTQKRVIGDDFNKIREYRAMPGRIHSLDFSPDGTLLRRRQQPRRQRRGARLPDRRRQGGVATPGAGRAASSP